MQNLDTLKSKLQMIGKKILGSNSFGIIYEDTSGLVLIKDTHGSTVEIRDIENFNIGVYFIIIGRENDRDKIKIYIKSKAEDVKPIHVYNIIYPKSNADFIENKRVGLRNTELLLIHGSDNKLCLLNYKGETLDLTKYLDHDPFKQLFIEKNNDGTYDVGYEATIYKKDSKGRHQKVVLNKHSFVKSIDRNLRQHRD